MIRIRESNGRIIIGVTPPVHPAGVLEQTWHGRQYRF